MPRKKRISVPGALHHVMSHAIADKDLFRDDDDRTIFLLLLELGIKRTAFRCYAWSLMDNHYHLLVRTNDLALKALMQRLNGDYARHYGKKYGHRGYVFQGRFKSIATQEQGYIEELVRYIHLNPVRAGICKDIDALDAYQWCGHAAVMGSRVCAFQDTDAVLKRFGKDTRAAQLRYRAFITDGIGSDEGDLIERLRHSNKEGENVRDYGCWVIGEPEFVKNAIAEDERRRLRLARMRRTGMDLDKLAVLVAKKAGIEAEELIQRGRENARAAARKAFAFAARDMLGSTVADIARYLGVSSPAVTKVLAEGQNLAKEWDIGREIDKVN